MENNLPSKVEIWSTIMSFVYGVLNFTNQDPYSSESFELSVKSFCAMKLTSFLITPDIVSFRIWYKVLWSGLHSAVV